jgi:hypothetical protein
MRTFSVVVSIAAVNGLVLAACVGSDPAPSSPSGVDGGTPATSSGGPTTGDAGSLSPDAAPPAGCPLNCLPPAPAGWKGPSAVYDGDPSNKPAKCPPLYTQLEVEGHQGLVGADAQCSCGTATFAGQTCTVEVRTYAKTGCTTGEVIESVTLPKVDACATANFAGGSGSLKVFAPTYVQGTCTFPSPTKTVPAETYEKMNVACGLPQNATCENRADCVATPIPEAPFSRLCISQVGEHQCPSADYSVGFVVYKSKTDDRGCTACTGTPTGSCGTKYGFASGPIECSTPTTAPATNNADGTCASNGNSYVNLRALAPTNLTCTPTGGTASGTIKSIDPVTFCCNK